MNITHIFALGWLLLFVGLFSGSAFLFKVLGAISLVAFAMTAFKFGAWFFE